MGHCQKMACISNGHCQKAACSVTAIYIPNQQEQPTVNHKTGCQGKARGTAWGWTGQRVKNKWAHAHEYSANCHKKGAIAQVVAWSPVMRRPRVQSPSCVGEACEDLFLALQHWRLCISHGSHDHANGGAVSLTLSGDIKEPLRMTSSLASDHSSVSLYIGTTYSIYMQGVRARWLWPATLDWKVFGTGLGCRGLVPCPWARHFTCMCTLSTQEWMGTWLDSDCLCVWTVTSAVMAAGLYAPQGVELLLEWTGPLTRENWCKVHRNII